MRIRSIYYTTQGDKNIKEDSKVVNRVAASVVVEKIMHRNRKR